MSYLIDTCVLSEARRQQADGGLVSWLEQADESHLFVSVITIGEVQAGVSKLPGSKKRRQLQRWLEQDLARRFEGRILSLDQECAITWGVLTGEGIASGRRPKAVDAMLAATALRHNLTFVTRNVRDFEAFPIRVENPWNETDS